MSMIENPRQVRAGDGTALWVVGDTYTIKADAASTGGLFGLIEASVPPGGGPPPHTHGREDEAFYVLSGRLAFRAGADEMLAGAGDFVYLPRGVEHSFTNPGDDEATALMLLTPGGFEGFFAEVGVPARPGERAPALVPADLAGLVAATERYGGRVGLAAASAVSGARPAPGPSAHPAPPASAAPEVPAAEVVFRAVDAMDAEALGALLAEDARMVFGNGEPLVGRDAILAGCGAFARTIGGLRHRITRTWAVGPDTIAETEVTYTRLDGTEVTVPAVSIWRVGQDGLIRDYRVFYDLAPVYAP